MSTVRQAGAAAREAHAGTEPNWEIRNLKQSLLNTIHPFILNATNKVIE
jgi:hypothetical protein